MVLLRTSYMYGRGFLEYYFRLQFSAFLEYAFKMYLASPQRTELPPEKKLNLEHPDKNLKSLGIS